MKTVLPGVCNFFLYCGDYNKHLEVMESSQVLLCAVEEKNPIQKKRPNHRFTNFTKL